MQQFTKLTSTCLPLRIDNIDTDQIIPAQFLKTTSKKGLGKYLFYNWRKENKFNGSICQTAGLLIAGNNFGCGSSREHAVWAIMDYGFRAIISSSYGDIFYNNSLKNGLLPVVLTKKELGQVFNIIKLDPKIKVIINLTKQTVSVPKKTSYKFPIDQFRKKCLLKGADELEYILSLEDKIEAYEKNNCRFAR